MRFRGRLEQLWKRLSGSLWFLPGVVVISFLAGAALFVELSILLDEPATERFPRVFEATAESARNLLSAVASSIITVAGVTFSILVVAVSQVSSQYSPLVLRNFLRDRLSQITLGVLVGVFVYCLIVLRTVVDGEDVNFVPVIAVTAALLFALLAVALLVYFIHHIASTLAAGSIVASIASDTLEAVDRLFPEQLGEGMDEDHATVDEEAFEWHVIAAQKSGYIQQVDGEGLLRLACEADALLVMNAGVGEFVAEGLPLVSLANAKDGEKVEQQIAGLYEIASYRTIHQDAAFGVRQIVDIATRALSPSTNDTTTAVTCIQYLSAVLARMAGRKVPSRLRRVQGKLRLIARSPTFERMLALAFDEIRRAARSNVRILESLAASLEQIAAFVPNGERRALLRAHIERVREALRADPTVAAEANTALASCARALERLAV